MKVRGREGAFIIHEVNSLDNRSDISEMKKLSLKNLKHIFFFVPEYKLSLE